jgi:hypothetical protein
MIPGGEEQIVDGFVSVPYVRKDLPDFYSVIQNIPNSRTKIRMLTVMGYLENLITEAEISRKVVRHAREFRQCTDPMSWGFLESLKDLDNALSEWEDVRRDLAND